MYIYIHINSYIYLYIYRYIQINNYIYIYISVVDFPAMFDDTGWFLQHRRMGKTRDVRGETSWNITNIFTN